MPSKLFNPILFNTTESSAEHSFDASLIYKTPGFYFTEEESAEETNLQLKEFQEGAVFPEFTQQYQHTLQCLAEKCEHYSVLITVPDEQEQPVRAFRLFQKRLFDSQDYYSTRKAELFCAGKKALEDILLLLHQELIPLDVKKKNLLNLQHDLFVCADGILGNILDVRDNLQTAYYGTHCLKTNALRTLIQQLAVETLRLSRTETDHYKNNELHYVNAYCNYVADSYGIPKKHDQIIKSLTISAEELQQFAHDADKAITPEALIGAIYHLLNDELMLMRESFFNRFFKEKNKIPLEEYQDLVNEGSKLVEHWNKRCQDLLPLDLNALFQLNNEGTHIIPSPCHEAIIKQIYSRNFSKLYLIPGSYEHSYKLDHNSNLVINNGFFWLEKEGKVMNLDPENVVKKKNQLRGNHVILYTLINGFPEKAQKLLQQCDDKNLHLNPVQLLRYGFNLTLKTALTDEQLTARYLTRKELQTVEFARAVNDFLTLTQRYTLIKLLLNKGWICTETITLFWPTLCAAQPQQLPGVIQQLLKMDLLTTELMNHTIPAYENNIVLFLARMQKFSLLNELFRKNLVTAHCLNSTVKGVNLAWILAKKGQFILFEDLLNQRLLTAEMLRVTPKQEHNIIWFLVKEYQTQIVAQLIQANLLTADLLYEAPDNNHALQLIINNGNYILLNLMLKSALATKELLAEKLQVQPVVWPVISHLIHEKQYELCEVLLDKNTLSWDISIPRRPGFLNQKRSSFTVDMEHLRDNNQIRLLEKFVEKKIISKTLFDDLLKNQPNPHASLPKL